MALEVNSFVFKAISLKNHVMFALVKENEVILLSGESTLDELKKEGMQSIKDLKILANLSVCDSVADKQTIMSSAFMYFASPEDIVETSKLADSLQSEKHNFRPNVLFEKTL